jgi:hypothetical protein
MDNEFKYTSGQYAKMLGISKEALRSRRRRRELESEYIIKNNICLYREPASNHSKKPPGQSSLRLAPNSSFRASRLEVRQRRRGSHGTSDEKYGKNYAFKKHNDLKMLAKLQRNVDPELQELLPEAIEQAKRIKEQKQKELQRELMNQRSKFYGAIYNPKFATPTWSEFKEKPKPRKYKYYD